MIAYNREELDALRTRQTAREWHDKGLLSAARWEAVVERNPVNFYSPNVFVRIGLAIFCLILLIAAAGLLMVFLEPNTDEGLAVFGLFFGAACLALLEGWIIAQARHYGSGIDDMLLYVGAGAIILSL